jgi:hypothetical protein
MPTRCTPEHRPSKLAAADCEPDDRHGPYTQKELLKMHARFVERMERAISGERGEGAGCAHCGKTFAPFRSDQRYCGQRCRQAAYHQRHL